jgi:hypothetical protein
MKNSSDLDSWADVVQTFRKSFLLDGPDRATFTVLSS